MRYHLALDRDRFTPWGHGSPGPTFLNVADSSWLPQIKFHTTKTFSLNKKKKKGKIFCIHILSISIDRLWHTFHKPISDRFWISFSNYLSLFISIAFPRKFSSRFKIYINRYFHVLSYVYFFYTTIYHNIKDKIWLKN